MQLCYKGLKDRASWESAGVKLPKHDWPSMVAETTVCLKNFLSEEKWNEINDFLKPGDRLKVQGEVEFDTFENLNVIRFREIEKIEGRMDREDTSEIGKRVELHLHTKM